MLTAADLAYMQDTQEQALPGTVVIERNTLVDDGMGGRIETWAAVGTVIGRVYPMVRRGMAEAVGGAQVQSSTQWFATLPVDTVIYAQDRLFYGDSTWEVLRVNNDEMWKTAARAELEKSNEERRT